MPEDAQSAFDDFVRRLIGHKVSYASLFLNSLRICVDRQLEESTGFFLWFEPVWHLGSLDGILVGSRQAQVEERDAQAALNLLVQVLVAQKLRASALSLLPTMLLCGSPAATGLEHLSPTQKPMRIGTFVIANRVWLSPGQQGPYGLRPELRSATHRTRPRIEVKLPRSHGMWLLPENPTGREHRFPGVTVGFRLAFPSEDSERRTLRDC